MVMTPQIKREISRRNLFRYLGNSIVFLPFMRTLMETQAFGEVVAKRAVFFYYPDGIVPFKFHPAAGALIKQDGLICSPLLADRVRSDVNIMLNLNYDTTNSHEGGTHHCLTGLDYATRGISIDTYLGSKFPGQIPVVRLGAAKAFEGGDITKAISFNANGDPLDVVDNPSQSFTTLFGGSTTAQAPTSGLNTKFRKSLLDDNLEQLKGLQAKLGTIEKAKLDLHVESIRELERRIDAGTATMDDSSKGAQCSKDSIKQTMTFSSKEDAYPKSYWKPENFDYVVDLNNQLAIQAMACGVTNIVTIMLSHAVSNMKFSGGRPDPAGGDHHEYSHSDQKNHFANQSYMMTKLADLIEGMGKVKEGDKSLLYNSIVLSVSELGDSGYHDFKNMGIAVAGQAGGQFKTGRCIDAGNAIHNNLLVSILQAMGLPDNKFGNRGNPGPLAALKG